ncbi:RNA polymerase II transcription mediator [Wolffia australiana]
MLNRNSPATNRRPVQLTPYKLKCEKEPLSGRIGPPDFHPQSQNCPEETLTREYLQTGYKDTVEGIEEAREITLTQVGVFSKPIVQKCKEALKKRLKAINESRTQKRKAGQVYGVPLSGQLLAKPGVYPEQKPYSEDSRKKWLEGLSQPHKRLRLLADHVPHGFKRNSLLDVLIRHNVPLLRATWFVKVNILNQSKSDKTQSCRSEQWTKIVIENLRCLLDDFLKEGLGPVGQSSQQSNSLISSGDEHMARCHWWYVVRLLQWHFSEGLLLPAPILEWVFIQLQERESVEALELLLPIIINIIEKVALSQHYVGTFFDIALRQMKNLNLEGADLSFEITKKRSQLASTLSEMLRYLILSVPDTFVVTDAFALPSCMTPENLDFYKSIINIPAAYPRSFGHVVTSLRKRVAYLSEVACPNPEGHGLAKVVETLDRSLALGDVKGAYICLFEELSGVIMEENWIREVNPCLWSSLKWIGKVSISSVCAVFFLCEWAMCDHRNFRTCSPHDLKFSGRKDLSQVYFAVSLLKLRKISRQKQHSSMAKNEKKDAGMLDFMQSPGPLHDIILCWLDQHEPGKGEGFRSLLVFIMELISCGIFHPHAYARQLIISGIMDDEMKRRNHYRILKQLPGSYLVDVLKEVKFDPFVLQEAVYIYRGERRLLLQGLAQVNFCLQKTENHGAYNCSDEVKNQSVGTKDGGGSPSELEISKNDSSLYLKLTKAKNPVAALKCSIMALLNIFQSPSNDFQCGDRHLKRNIAKVDGVDGMMTSPEESSRAKIQKLSDCRDSPVTGFEDEESWWVRKGSKSVEKPESFPKMTKHTSRGRRKTQSLAQLAAARIEGSQGASTSHVCENKLPCVSHKFGSDDSLSLLSTEVLRTRKSTLRTIGRALKQLRLLEKKSVIIWLLSLIKMLIESNDKAGIRQNNGSSPFSPSVGDRTAVRWKLGNEELSSVLYLFDVSCDWLSSVKLLLWLLPKVLGGSTFSAHNSRNVMIFPKNKENADIEVSESFFLSVLQRYENILVAAELLPEALTIAMQRAASVIAASGRSSSSSALSFIRKMLKKYGEVPSVSAWEKNARSTCDPRVLAELESDLGYSIGFPSGVEDHDEYLRQKMAGKGRVSRAGLSMKEMVQRHIDEAFVSLYGRENKSFGVNNSNNAKGWDDDTFVSQKVVLGLMECIRQNGGSAGPEIDPFLVSSAISAIVGNLWPAIVNSNHQNLSLPEGSLSYIQRVVRIHLSCLCLLKEALGDRYNRIFDLAIASESSSIVSGACSAVKFPHRGQFLEIQDAMNPGNQNGEALGGRESVKNAAAAAVSALVIGAVVHGLSTLERMITAFRLKEGLDVQQLIRHSRTSSNNGLARSNSKPFVKLDPAIESAYVHWFRVLIGNFSTVLDGLIADIIDDSWISGFSRMQGMVPLSTVLPPCYSMLALAIWRPYILGNSIPTHEDIQLFQSLTSAVDEVIRHRPFRDTCFKDTRLLYDLLASDSGDSEFASMFDLQGQDEYQKSRVFLPLRARLFLNAMIDCRLPPFTLLGDDGTGDQSPFKPETKLLDELVHILDTLQPAKFHWQWVMVRLLLNEQALVKKMETLGMSFSEAICSLYPKTDNSTLSETESSFTDIVLTRILVRPDAATLYSDVLRLLGRSLEEKLLLLVKWFLGGNDVLLGRKSIRQRLMNLALRKGVSTKTQFFKPWGWSSSDIRADEKKVELSVLEEGEVVDEVVADGSRLGRANTICQSLDAESLASSQQQLITEKALAELVLPCIDRSSADARDTFAAELINQMCLVDQHVLSIFSNPKAGSLAQSGMENLAAKGANRKNIQGGSPGIGRRTGGTTDSTPPSASALRASMWLRLQFILRSLPAIYTDRDPSVRSMRHKLTSVLLHLLGTRVIYEDADLAFFPSSRTAQKLGEPTADPVLFSPLDCAGGSLFDMFLSVFHGLLSGCKPSWLKPNASSKSLAKAARDSSAVDRDFADKLQAELDHMILPPNIWRRIQVAMPILPPSSPLFISCHPPTLSTHQLAPFQVSIPTQRASSSSSSSSSSGRLPSSSAPARTKALTAPEPDLEADPWTLLEDGTGSFTAAATGNADAGGFGGDAAVLKACSWLKGAVRVRRADLTYIGARDEDS